MIERFPLIRLERGTKGIGIRSKKGGFKAVVTPGNCPLIPPGLCSDVRQSVSILQQLNLRQWRRLELFGNTFLTALHTSREDNRSSDVRLTKNSFQGQEQRGHSPPTYSRMAGDLPITHKLRKQPTFPHLTQDKIDHVSLQSDCWHLLPYSGGMCSVSTLNAPEAGCGVPVQRVCRLQASALAGR